MTIVVWAGVAVCGGFGAVLRFLIDGTIARHAWNAFPIGTLAVNLSGAVVLGLLTGLAVGDDAALLAGTAVVGSYTTFSTWMFETHRLTEERQLPIAALNVVVSIVAGVAAAALGQWIGASL